MTSLRQKTTHRNLGILLHSVQTWFVALQMECGQGRVKRPIERILQFFGVFWSKPNHSSTAEQTQQCMRTEGAQVAHRRRRPKDSSWDDDDGTK